MIKVFDEKDIPKMSFGRNGSRIAKIKQELREKHLKKGECCLLNSIVVEYSKDKKSDPGLHSQLRNALDKDPCFNVVTKDGRVVVVCVA